MTIEHGKGKGVGYEEFFQPIRSLKHGDWGIQTLCEYVDDGTLDLDPPYQRDHVWTTEQQEQFVGFMLQGGRAPEVFVRENGYEKAPYLEVVDGKQRITAFHAFWTGLIPGRLSNGRLIWVKDFAVVENRFMKRQMNTSVQFIEGTDAEIMRVYLRLNRGGTVHSDAEIEKVERLLEVVA